MTDQRKIKAVVFDFGETLLTFGRVDVNGLFRAGAQLTHQYLKSLNQPIGGFKWYYIRNMVAVRIHYLLGKIGGWDFDSLELLKRVGTKKGLNLTDQQWEHMAWLWYEPLSKMAKAEPDIQQTLESLKSLGLKLGIVSNTFVPGANLDRHLRQEGILEYFEPRIYSCEFGFRKPDPRIFHIAAERIDTPMENIMFVGDRLDTDVSPSSKLGMVPVLKNAYTNGNKPTPDGVYRIDNLSELPDIVRTINEQAQDDHSRANAQNNQND